MKKILLTIVIFMFLYLLVFCIPLIRNMGIKESNYTSLIEEFITTKDTEEADYENYVENFGGKKCFANVKEYGKKGNHVYALILSECYYKEDDKVISGSGYYIPFNFKIENDKIVSYEEPTDGEGYDDSLKELFPSPIRSKIYYDMENSELIESIKNDLDDQAKKYFDVSQIYDYYEIHSIDED